MRENKRNQWFPHSLDLSGNSHIKSGDIAQQLHFSLLHHDPAHQPNPVPSFAAVVTCRTAGATGVVAMHFTSANFPATPQGNGTPHARACSRRARATAGGVGKATAVGPGPVARLAVCESGPSGCLAGAP